MKYKPLRTGSLTLFLIFFSITLFAQQKTITGRILDQDSKQPLSGVSIGVKGTSATVVSDNSGGFSIAVPSDDAMLEVTYVGYTPQQIKVGAQSTIAVGMISANKQLGEVVVVGYGT